MKTIQEIKELKEEIARTYEITYDGKCWNKNRNTMVKFPLDHKGYNKTRLWCPAISKNKDKRIPFRLHRLVAMFHIKNFDPKLEVNHKNGIKTDNRVENLEMVTTKENVLHAWNVLDSEKRRKAVGDRRRGMHHTDETKEKISKKKKRLL